LVWGVQIYSSSTPTGRDILTINAAVTETDYIYNVSTGVATLSRAMGVGASILSAGKPCTQTATLTWQLPTI
jgi:hypothetical protein